MKIKRRAPIHINLRKVLVTSLHIVDVLLLLDRLLLLYFSLVDGCHKKQAEIGYCDPKGATLPHIFYRENLSLLICNREE